MLDATLARILDHVADIYVALKGIGAELDEWNAKPRSGRIFINGVESRMTTPETPIEIPTDNVPCRVDWADRLGTSIQHSATDTVWSVVDQAGAPTTVVSVEPDTSDAQEETGTVTFNSGSGTFRLIATTQGATGAVEARSALYNIVAGAPAVGVITVSVDQ